MGWWFARLGAFSARPRVGRMGVANVGLLQAWSAKVPKMAHCRPKIANRWLEVPDWSIVFQKQPQKNAVWQATATVASAAEKRANLGQHSTLVSA